MNFDEFRIRNTIRILCMTAMGIATGTGFFFEFTYDEESKIPVIVTNKHVVKGGITGKLVFSIANDNREIIENKKYEIVVENFEQTWIMHPDDSVDLCVLPIAPLCDDASKKGKKLAIAMLSKENIISGDIINKISKVEEITVVGYPDGIWDSFNNLPIVRRGITATPIAYNFENKKRFLIDSAIYGGSSGSPVYIFNQGAYQLENTLYAGSRLMLVGIIFAVAQHTVTGDLTFVDVPVSKQPITITQIPNNLGVVIHSEEFLVFEEILKNIVNYKGTFHNGFNIE